MTGAQPGSSQPASDPFVVSVGSTRPRAPGMEREPGTERRRDGGMDGERAKDVKTGQA